MNILIYKLLKHFFIFKTVTCVWVKTIYTSTLLFFVLPGTASLLKTFYMSLYSTKRKTWKRRRLSAIKKLLRFLWMLMDVSLPKFDIYQGTRATNYFKSHTNSWYLHFFSRKGFVLCPVWNSPCLSNIISTRQSVWS